MKLKSMVVAAAVMAGASVTQAATVFLDTFSGPGTNLPSGVFDSGASSSFTFWPIGTPGNMSEGRFSVVNKARDVHASFVTKLDANNDPNGKYAIFNGFISVEQAAYKIVLSNLVAGETYTFSAAVLPLAPNPPFPQNSLIDFRHNGASLPPTFTLNPVPLNTEQWVVVSRTFVATGGSDELSIWNLAGPSNSGNDFGIDNVMVSHVIPLPAPLAMGAGVLGLMATRRKRA